VTTVRRRDAKRLPPTTLLCYSRKAEKKGEGPEISIAKVLRVGTKSSCSNSKGRKRYSDQRESQGKKKVDLKALVTTVAIKKDHIASKSQHRMTG